MYKLLIVDDEEKERSGIAGLVEKFAFPFEISQAKNGMEALEMVRKESFDVLLTDIKMPLMNGLELIKEVQKLGTWMIFIVYSAYAYFEYARSAISLGVIRYLLKPVSIADFKQLFSEVESLCLNKMDEKTDLREVFFDLSKGQTTDKPKNHADEPGQNRLIKKTKNLILVHHADPNLSLSFLADRLKISSAYLSTLFKSETGKNISSYITEIRVSRAKQILKQSSMKIKEVGEAVGYLNESYFIKSFKDREGISPMEFRLKGDKDA